MLYFKPLDNYLLFAWGRLFYTKCLLISYPIYCMYFWAVGLTWWIFRVSLLGGYRLRTRCILINFLEFKGIIKALMLIHDEF